MGRKRRDSLEYLEARIWRSIKNRERKGDITGVIACQGQLLQIQKERHDREQAAPKQPSDAPTGFKVRFEDNLELPHEYFDADALFKRVTGDLSYLFAHHYGIEQGMVSNKPGQSEGFWPWMVRSIKQQWPDFWRLYCEETNPKNQKLLASGDDNEDGDENQGAEPQPN